MKRSDVNAIVRRSKAFLAEMKFLLPPFAHWTPEEWTRKGPECRAIPRQNLGWDITDFGSGDFAKIGLFLFTVRNGTVEELRQGRGKLYAEKIMIVQEEQVTPTHFHASKMEDIINRGGGNLMMRLWNATADNRLADTEVVVSVDSVEARVKAGGTLRLRPGESVTFPQRLFHRFWGEKGAGTVLVGEVSLVNDDHTDNLFFDKVGRFPAIEEDEAPLHLLCNDYKKYYRYTE